MGRVIAGTRDFPFLRWRPRFAFGLLVLPLCGAALTFFAAAKKVSKESGLTPRVLVVTHGLSTSPSLMRQRSRGCPLPTHDVMPHPLQARE